MIEAEYGPQGLGAIVAYLSGAIGRRFGAIERLIRVEVRDRHRPKGGLGSGGERQPALPFDGASGGDDPLFVWRLRIVPCAENAFKYEYAFCEVAGFLRRT